MKIYKATYNTLHLIPESVIGYLGGNNFRLFPTEKLFASKESAQNFLEEYNKSAQHLGLLMLLSNQIDEVELE